MTAQASEIRIEELEFRPPSPGSWELDRTHFPRPVARFMLDPRAYEEPQERGFTWCFRRYGLLVDRLEERFVHGFVYSCVRPASEAEIPERFENAARVFERKLWRADLRQWDEEVKPASIRAHLALGEVDPWALEREELVAHLAACYSHMQRMIEQHYRFTIAAVLPIGDFLIQGGELSGAPPTELLLLMRGSAPVSAGAADGLDRLVAAIRGDAAGAAALAAEPGPREVLDALQRLRGPVGAAARDYLAMVECRLLDGYDVGCACAFEKPEILAGAIRRAVERGRYEVDAEVQTARVRERVPAAARDYFDDLLAEARSTYRLREERSVYSTIWAVGLMRRAILAAGDRLVAEHRVEDPADLVEAQYDEIVSLLRTGEGPAAADLATYARFRADHTAADAPRLLGDPPPPPPPLDGLPEPAARAMRAVGACIHLLFADCEQQSEGTVVRGLPASPGVYEGTARVLSGPEQLDRLRPGDVLVVGSTSEAFIVVLPLVGAIVTDSGGLLSHPAIVSREFGIPGVVGCRDATVLIEDASTVRVDGGAGEVMVLR